MQQFDAGAASPTPESPSSGLEQLWIGGMEPYQGYQEPYPISNRGDPWNGNVKPVQASRDAPNAHPRPHLVFCSALPSFAVRLFPSPRHAAGLVTAPGCRG